jgi:phage terminase small subunit
MSDDSNIVNLDRITDGMPVRERYETFCGHFVETRNKLQAYRMAFIVDETKTAAWVRQQADALMRDPYVLRRIQELRDEAAALTLVSITELFQQWHDIAVADPNDIVAHVRTCCRFCHGVSHAYQWQDAAEYAAAVGQAETDAKMEKRDTRYPDMSGGFGFHAMRDPVSTCPACYGQGHGRVHIADTRRLEGPARRLYAGAKEKADGSIEVLLHDQQKARESLAKCLGALKEAGIPITPIEQDKARGPITAEQAQKGYLRLVSG